ncbi:MAG: sugar phosphate isomerase/epimerase family protein [Capsulimonadales bacterium]|nr:sugar phosphate isomerase/epimerase family protein [Capsulimonadales bacterium]
MSDRNIISVNLGSYGHFREGALAHLAELGVRHVEIGVPKPEEVEEWTGRLTEYGLSATTLQCPCDLSEEPETMRPSLEVGKAMGVGIFFVSVKAGEKLTKPQAYDRLRARAEMADEYGITLAMETHPDLGENFNEARATIHAVAHPRLRWNLDTANLYYYNANMDAVETAKKGASLIAAVHLKDTNGAQRCWWFPALGDGVVDFGGVFGVLGAVGFRGPYTLELEGVEGRPLDEAGTKDQVARSIAHLRALGVF